MQFCRRHTPVASLNPYGLNAEALSIPLYYCHLVIIFTKSFDHKRHSRRTRVALSSKRTTRSPYRKTVWAQEIPSSAGPRDQKHNQPGSAGVSGAKPDLSQNFLQVATLAGSPDFLVQVEVMSDNAEKQHVGPVLHTTTRPLSKNIRPISQVPDNPTKTGTDR